MSKAGKETDGDYDYDDHFDYLEHGAGCTEIWEHLSEQRGNDKGGKA
ncbi:MAG: hypothetical protein SXQ77_00455 [Halobacteria archaeon]|nr:hypothetical protein [Halobacteria archaeon]